MSVRAVQDAERQLSLARAARDWLVDWLNAREAVEPARPRATLDREQSTLGEIELLARSSRCLIDSLTIRVQSRSAFPAPNADLDADIVRTIVARHSLAAIDLALATAGAAGLAAGSPLLRLHREAVQGRTHSPGPEAVLVAAGQQALGIAANSPS